MKMTIRQTGENKYRKSWKLDNAEAIGLGLLVIIILILILL
jgi:hypothetical protein